jgi:hypothetical protein
VQALAFALAWTRRRAAASLAEASGEFAEARRRNHRHLQREVALRRPLVDLNRDTAFNLALGCRFGKWPPGPQDIGSIRKRVVIAQLPQFWQSQMALSIEARASTGMLES